MSSVYYNAQVFLAYYGVCLAPIGTIGNIFSFIICIRAKLRQVPTFVFIASSLLMDIISLYFWGFNNYFTTFYGFTMADFNVHSCRATTFLQGFSMQASAWILVATSLERYLSVRINNWRSVYFKPKHALFISCAIILITCFGNIYLVGTLPFPLKENASRFDVCFRTIEYRTWRAAHTYLYAIVPFVILAITNSMLLYHIITTRHKSSTNDNRKSKTQSMTITIIVLTFTFIMMSGPVAIGGGYYLNQLLATQQGRVAIFAMIELGITFHGINFIILMSSNKKFYSEVKSILSKWCNNSVKPLQNIDSSLTTNNLTKSKKAVKY